MIHRALAIRSRDLQWSSTGVPIGRQTDQKSSSSSFARLRKNVRVGRATNERSRSVRIFAMVAVLALLLSPAAAQHHHPPQDADLHERFYSTWYMPDNPIRSCCNKADCYPTEIKVVGSSIYARRREDGKYILVPAHKVEQNRDNPDGRNHICAPPPGAISYPPDTVFCFSLGGGI